MARISEEDLMQISVMDFVRYHNLDKFIFHVAGERICSPQAGAKLKRKGVLAGVSDILILKPSKSFSGACIELKTPTGRLSNHQKSFLSLMKEHGYFTAVCRSAREAKDIISFYLELNTIPLRTPPHEL